MAFTQTQLTSLEKAIAEGALEVQYADRKVVYRSLLEMMQLRDLMRKQLGEVENQGVRIATKFDKGL